MTGPTELLAQGLTPAEACAAIAKDSWFAHDPASAVQRASVAAAQAYGEGRLEAARWMTDLGLRLVKASTAVTEHVHPGAALAELARRFDLR